MPQGTGKEHRVALEAGGIAQGRRQVGFPQADPPQKDQIGFVLDKREAEVVLHLETVNPRRPVPAELIEGFNDGKARQTNTALGGTIVPHARFAFQEFGQIVHMEPRFVGGLLGQRGILLCDKGELQIREMVLDGAQRLWRHRQGVVFSHGGVPPLGRGLAAVGWRDKC